MLTSEITDPVFWKDIQPGQTLVLTNKAALDISLAKGNGLDGIRESIETIWNIHEENGLCEWVIMSLQAGHLWLSARIVEQEVSLFFYVADESITWGNRKDMVDNGEFWMFQEPEDPDNFDYLDLRYTTNFSRDEIDFKQKIFGELEGRATENPSTNSSANLLASISEYVAEDVFKEAMLLELGDAANEEGGLIKLLIGESISSSEVDVL